MSLIDLLRLARAHIAALLVIPALVGLASAAYAWGVLPDQYTASVNLYVVTKTADALNGEESVNMSLSQQVANDVSVLIDSERVKSAAASSLGLDSLSGFEVAVESASNNRVVSISVTGANPDSVAQVANQLAKETVDVAVETLDLQAVNIVDQAKVPSDPSGPNRIKVVFAAIFVGFCIALLGVLLANALDTTARSSEEAGKALGYPVLGVMPDAGKEA